ncbi:MAG TPA: hypothetical protein PKV98_16330 [Burkholderiaceae bacterium]|nr:hypothetical protein [Burkholderiaceae bacterium]
MESLSRKEDSRLAELEGKIERSVRSWIDTGNALRAIRDEKLYRATHKTFDAYCAARWKLKRTHAYRLIQSAAIAESVPVRGQKFPITEMQARSLLPLSDELRTEAIALAVDRAPKGEDGNPKVTNRAMAEAAREVLATQEEPVRTNVVSPPPRRPVTLKPGHPEESAAAITAAWPEYDVIKFYSELGYRLHMGGKIVGWVEHFEEIIAKARAAA